MKRLILILPLIALAAATAHAGHIATVSSFNGDIIIKHNGVYSWAALNATIDAHDEITIKVSDPNTSLTLTNIFLPGGPTSTITPSMVPTTQFWSAKQNRLVPLNQEDDNGALIPPGPDDLFSLCYGKLVNGDPLNHTPIANAQGHIVENPSLLGTTDANGNFRINGHLPAGTYHVQFDGWTGPVQFTHGVIGANIGTLMGNAQ
jgi:hypothetical protein